MAILWTPDLAIGVEPLDAQHQRLFAVIDELVTAMETGEGRTRVAEVLRFLKGYLVEHFSAEERFMIEKGYAGYEGHKRQHDELIQDFLALEEELAAHGPTTALVIAVNTRLAQWLRSHVSRVDRALARAVAGR